MSDIRYTQATVSIKTGDGTPVLNIASEMKANGWDLSKGVPDLIRLDDGFMTLGHRRLVAADWAGLNKRRNKEDRHHKALEKVSTENS